MLTTDEAAELLSVSPRTLEAWRVQHPPKGPEFIRIEGQVRYPRESLADYLTASFNKPALPRALQAKPDTPTPIDWHNVATTEDTPA
jgi:hypothetical protein